MKRIGFSASEMSFENVDRRRTDDRRTMDTCIILYLDSDILSQTILCYAPNFEKVGGILVSACPYVCMYVRTYVCIHVRDIVLKLHVWIPHGKIADAYFWFSLNYLPLSNYGPLTNKGMKFCKCHISKSIIARNLKLVSADRG